MKTPLNLTALSKKYGQCYVARVTGTNKVVAHARRVDELMDKIKNRKDRQKVVISWIPEYGTRYVFSISLCVRRG